MKTHRRENDEKDEKMNQKLMMMLKMRGLYCQAADGEGNDLSAAAPQKETPDEGTAKQTEDGNKTVAQNGEPDKATEKQAAKPSDEEAKLLKDLMKHKERAQKLEKELQDATKAVQAFAGLDPEKVRKLAQEQEEAERKSAEARGEYDRIVSQMKERHTEESAAMKKQLSEYDSEKQALRQQIADLTVGNAFSLSKYIADDDFLLTPTKARVIYGAHFEFKDGAVVGYDKPAGSSERTLLVDAKGDALSFDEAMKKIVDADPDRDTMLRSKARNGSGSNTVASRSATSASEKNNASTRSMTPAEKIALGLKNLQKV